MLKPAYKTARILAAVAALATALPWASAAQAQAGSVYSSPTSLLWQGEATKGPLVYKPLNLGFPEKLGSFDRLRVGGFDGLPDFWVSYSWKRPAGEAKLTVFLFKPRSEMAEHTVAGSISALNMVLGGAGTFVWADGPRIIKTSERELRFFKGTYKTGMGPGTVLDYIYFADLGTWRVKVRVTLPGSKETTDETEIERAISGLDWKTIMNANGACTGLACSLDSPIVFDNHFGEMVLSSLINGGKGNKVGGEAGKPLFERKVEGTLWKVEVLDSKLQPLFEESFGGLSVGPRIYSLSWKKGGKAGIVRFFSGEPSAAMVDREIAQLTMRPENSPFTPLADAAFYAAD